MKIVAKSIDVIASFIKDKKPIPIRFRLIEDEKNIVINVDKIISIDKEKLAGQNIYVYKCQSVIDNIQKPYELKYDIEKCKWILFKI